ncbi:hypothetical protein K3495_g257 [Podosphaera aphanis]|nr:hypothetical protein K3495_g257 [Podosphaera aphanis]
MAAAVSYQGEKEAVPMRKKLKASDLPLASATRAAIEGLAHTFKKKGGYDSLRKQVWADLTKSTYESEFTESLVKAAEIELEKSDYDLLRKSRSTAQALIHGAVERAGVYRDSEQQIDALIDAHIAEIESGIRAIRKNDIGEEAAAAEQVRGAKTDEQYAQEANLRREARDKARREAREKEIALREKKREEERAKKREEEKKLEEEMEKKRIEREARRKAEREREEQKERDLKERERREREKERERRQRRHEEDSSRKETKEQMQDPKELKNPDVIKPELTPEEIERLEREALNHLLKPTSSRVKHHLDLEIDKTLTPPPRKIVSNSAIQPISRDHSKLGTKKPPPITTKMKAEPQFKMPLRSNEKLTGSERKIDSNRRRSRSHDRGRERTFSKRSSRSRSRSRSRHGRNRDTRHSRRDSKERPRDDRHGNHSRERENRHKDDRRRKSKDRDDGYRHDRRHSHRSHSIGIEKKSDNFIISDRDKLGTQTKEVDPLFSGSLPIKEPSLIHVKEAVGIFGNSSARKSEFSRDRMKHARSRSRSTEAPTDEVVETTHTSGVQLAKEIKVVAGNEIVIVIVIVIAVGKSYPVTRVTMVDLVVDLGATVRAGGNIGAENVFGVEVQAPLLEGSVMEGKTEVGVEKRGRSDIVIVIVVKIEIDIETMEKDMKGLEVVKGTATRTEPASVVEAVEEKHRNYVLNL